MNYRHLYHAGNFADCLKHAALVAILLHLLRKPNPFAVIDTHAGSGRYDLRSAQAQKTAEAEAGIGRLLPMSNLPGVLKTYVDLVRAFGDGQYPGSPLIALKLMRAQDRLVAIEKEDGEYHALAAALAGAKKARAILGDGYRELSALLPPAERRGLILIDPPFEAEDEFVRAAQTLILAYRKFRSGIFLLWYPAKSAAEVAATAGELLNAGIASLLRVALDVGTVASRRERLSATGLFVVNPPFGFAAEMEMVAKTLAALLGEGGRARGSIEVLAAR